MEDSHIISAIKEQEKNPVQEKKPVERAIEDLQKISKDIIEIKSVVEEIKAEFRDFNEQTKKGWMW
jgi:hypothetical protein